MVVRVAPGAIPRDRHRDVGERRSVAPVARARRTSHVVPPTDVDAIGARADIIRREQQS